MKAVTRAISILAASSLAAAAFAQPAPDFSTYVALGDSLTAGYESGCVVDRHQLRSYPAQLAALTGTTVAGPGDTDPSHFQQPLISEPGFLPCYQASFDPASGSIVVAPPSVAPGQPENLTLPVPYNNLGIPGANLSDILNTYTNPSSDLSSPLFNPFFDFVLRNQSGSKNTALEEAIGKNPTFVTVWIGNNDVLRATTIGIAISPQCSLISHDPSGSCDGVTLTPDDTFAQEYTTALQTLHAALPNATIVVANVPDVTAIPFVETLPPVVFDPATLRPILDPNGHTIPLIGTAHDGSVGPIPGDTIVTLKAAPLLAQGAGIPCAVYMANGGSAGLCVGNMPDGSPNPAGMPLPDGSITFSASGVTVTEGVLLYADEHALIEQHIEAYNAAIAQAAAAVGAKVFDINALFQDVAANGRTYAGVHLSDAYLTGGIFSYDGIHPSNVGYTLLTDEMVKFLNASFGTHIPRPNVYAALFEDDVPPSAGASVARAMGVAPLARRGSLFPPLSYFEHALADFGLSGPDIRVVPLSAQIPDGGAAAIIGRR